MPYSVPFDFIKEFSMRVLIFSSLFLLFGSLALAQNQDLEDTLATSYGLPGLFCQQMSQRDFITFYCSKQVIDNAEMCDEVYTVNVIDLSQELVVVHPGEKVSCRSL